MNKIKHNCKRCKCRSEDFKEWSEAYKELSEFYKEMSEDYAEKCRCKDE